MLGTADAAMYAAKHAGRNRINLSDDPVLDGDENPPASEPRELKTHDLPTSLSDRTLLWKQIERITASTHKDQHAAALLMLDIDRFKQASNTSSLETKHGSER